MTENPGAGSGAKAAPTQVEGHVALGDLTNVAAAEWRLSAPDAVLMLAAPSEKRVEPMKEQSVLTKQETIDDGDMSLKDMLSGIYGMDKIITTIDELISRHLDERSKVQSLEQERDQLRSQVALLQSKLHTGDCSALSTKVPCTVNTLAMDIEEKPKLNEMEDWLRTVELKGRTGGTKKQPVVIGIWDDEDTSMWCDDDENPSLKSNASGSGEPGSGSCQSVGSYEWFFCGNKLILSYGMKMHLKELCGCVPPEIPFYIYRMNKSNVRRKGKMLLSAKYISKSFLSCLHEGEGYAHFEIDGDDHGTVRIKLNADGRASLTSGWENVVAAKDIKAGDTCAFHFKIYDGVLKLSVYVFHAVCHLVCVRRSSQALLAVYCSIARTVNYACGMEKADNNSRTVNYARGVERASKIPQL